MQTSKTLLLLSLLAAAAAARAAEPAPTEAGTEASQFRFERQLRVNPFDPAALNNLAVIKAGQGRYDDALDLLQRAARLAPQSAEIASNISRLQSWLQSLGRDPAAFEQPALGLANVPPEPPRLWDPGVPRR